MGGIHLYNQIKKKIDIILKSKSSNQQTYSIFLLSLIKAHPFYVKNYKTGIQRGIDWNNVIIDEVSASSQKADEFEFDVTSVNIIAHCDDRLIEITIKNAFAVNGSWKLNDKVEFSF